MKSREVIYRIQKICEKKLKVRSDVFIAPGITTDQNTPEDPVHISQKQWTSNLMKDAKRQWHGTSHCSIRKITVAEVQDKTCGAVKNKRVSRNFVLKIETIIMAKFQKFVLTKKWSKISAKLNNDNFVIKLKINLQKTTFLYNTGLVDNVHISCISSPNPGILF